MNSPTHDNVANALGTHLDATGQFIAENVTDNEIETRLKRLTERILRAAEPGADRDDSIDPANELHLPWLDGGFAPPRANVRGTTSVEAEPVRKFDIYDELLEIPRGRGMLAHDVAERIGPGLHAACAISLNDSPAMVRRKVGERLQQWCGTLPTDLRVCVLAALALHPEVGHQFMQDRMSWAAKRINRDHPRAAVRRMKAGFQIIAKQLDDLVHDPRINQGWHTGSLRTLLRMDLDPPQLFEERTIVATSDSLAEVELRLSARHKDGQPPITASIVYGGEITGSDIVRASHRTFALRLPTPLRAGEQHEYGLRFTASPRAVMPPFYVLTPLQPCDKFALRVRFGVEQPEKIWRIDGVPPRTLNDFTPDDARVRPDRFGEVSMEFSQLQQGLSYGLRWSKP